MLIQFQDLKLKIVAVGFFFTALSQLIFFFKFNTTLSADNYASKTPSVPHLISRQSWPTNPSEWYLVVKLPVRPARHKYLTFSSCEDDLLL